MNTMKKEDMLKEQAQLVENIGKNFLYLVGIAGRWGFLQNEIDKVTPKKEIKDVELDSKKETS